MQRKEKTDKIAGKVSVIIPTYNRADTIERAVRSVLAQTYTNLEVIVVDDGSSDHTEDVVKRIEDERVRFYRLPSNGGVGHARNEGVKLAGTELIAFHDSDDVWRPEKLEKQMAYWEKYPEFGMIYCPYLFHRLDGSEMKIPDPAKSEKLEGDIFYSLLVRNSIGAPTVLMRKKCFVACGGFDESLKCLEDWEFALRFAHDFQIGYMDEIQVDAYRTPGSVSSEAGGFFETRCRMIAVYQKELVRADLFDEAVSDLFRQAESCDVLDKVKKMLLLMLQNC